MKRILSCVIVLTFLLGCTRPSANAAAGTAAARQSETERIEASESNGGGEIQIQPKKEADSLRADAVEETVLISAPEAPQEQEQEPAPFGLLGNRFADKFSDEPEYGERSYRSKTISITIQSYTVKDTYANITTYHVADIYVQDVTSIRTAAAKGNFNTRYSRTVREIAKDVGALLAIDGDSYAREKGSFVIRNGELYRQTLIEDTDLCILYRDGRMETKRWGTFTMQEIIDADPWQVWGFGPALLDEEGHSMEINHRLASHNPRAAIGYYEPGHYCFVIVDGRQPDWSVGVRLTALSRLMEDLGCKVAYNLDGGGSAQMYWDGDIISKSCNESRVVSDIIYILPEEE